MRTVTTHKNCNNLRELLYLARTITTCEIVTTHKNCYNSRELLQLARTVTTHEIFYNSQELLQLVRTSTTRENCYNSREWLYLARTAIFRENCYKKRYTSEVEDSAMSPRSFRYTNTFNRKFFIFPYFIYAKAGSLTVHKAISWFVG